MTRPDKTNNIVYYRFKFVFPLQLHHGSVLTAVFPAYKPGFASFPSVFYHYLLWKQTLGIIDTGLLEDRCLLHHPINTVIAQNCGPPTNLATPPATFDAVHISSPYGN